MRKIKKTFIQKAVIAPVAIGAVTAVLFFACLPAVFAFFPFAQREITIAEFEQGMQETVFDQSNAPADGVLKKRDILFAEKNKCIGCIVLGGKSIPLAADANQVSLTGALSFSSKGKYIGEVGCAYVYGLHSVLDIGALRTGSDVQDETEYGSYVFTVTEIKKSVSEYDIFSSRTDAGRGLLLYANADNGPGVSCLFDAAVMEMKSGPAVNE